MSPLSLEQWKNPDNKHTWLEKYGYSSQRVEQLIAEKLKDVSTRWSEVYDNHTNPNTEFLKNLENAKKDPKFSEAYARLVQDFISGFASGSATKLRTYRERRHIYMDSEWALQKQFWQDEVAKDRYILEEMLRNNIELILMPKVALLARTYAPRIQWERHLYDAETFQKFREEMQRIDIENRLSVFAELESAGNRGKSLWEVRMDIYRWVIEKLNPKGKTWMLQMLAHGNWKAASDIRGYTTYLRDIENNTGIFEILQQYDTALNNLLWPSGELNKIRQSSMRWKFNEISTESIYFSHIIPSSVIPSDNIQWFLNWLHQFAFSAIGWQAIEDSLAWITPQGVSIDGIDRMMNVVEWVTIAVGWGLWASRLSTKSSLWLSIAQVLPKMVKDSSPGQKTMMKRLLEVLFGKWNSLAWQVK